MILYTFQFETNYYFAVHRNKDEMELSVIPKKIYFFLTIATLNLMFLLPTVMASYNTCEVGAMWKAKSKSSNELSLNQVSESAGDSKSMCEESTMLTKKNENIKINDMDFKVIQQALPDVKVIMDN